MKRLAGLLLAVALVAGVQGCAPVIQNHGYAPDDILLADIQAGQDTKGSVRRKIGRPGTSGLFNDTGWFYVASTVERYTYHAPKVVDRRVVAIEFDANEVVTAVNTYGMEEGRVIDLQTRTTPTFGRKLTILQQLLGNLGQLSADDILQE